MKTDAGEQEREREPLEIRKTILIDASPEIVFKAIIDPNNIPSRKILMNVGFTSEFIGDMDGLPGEILNLKMQSQ
jgi:hypothetical protein